MTPKQLIAKRKALNLSRAALGKAVGRSERQVGGWENGTTPVPSWLPILIQTINPKDTEGKA